MPSLKKYYFIIIALGMRSKKRSFNEEYSNGTVANCNSFFCLILYHLICRVGQPEDCAGVVMFLCSKDAGYITGETVVSAGGMLSRL